MEIVVQQTLSGFMSSTNTKLGTKVIKLIDHDKNLIAYITGDSLNYQLQEYGFEIKDI